MENYTPEKKTALVGLGGLAVDARLPRGGEGAECCMEVQLWEYLRINLIL